MKSNNNIYSFSELTIDNVFLSKPYDFKLESDNIEKSFCFVKKLFNTDKIATVHQVHSNKVVCIDEKNYNLEKNNGIYVSSYIPGDYTKIKSKSYKLSFIQYYYNLL